MLGFVTKRKEMKMTQKEFAEFLGIPLRTLESYEQGRRLPTITEAVRISKLLGEGIEEVFTQKLFKEE